MRQKLNFSFRFVILLALCLFFTQVLCVHAANGEKVNKRVTVSKNNSNKNNNSDKYVTIDFNDVDINVLIKFISELTGKNFIVDNRVKGKVTIISPAKISV